MKEFFHTPARTFAHRGAPMEFPENTLPSFQRAAELGVDVIETDVHLTKDGKFVLVHDDRLDRVSDGTGMVSDRTMEELKKLDAGYRFTKDGRTFPFRGKGLAFLSLEELLEAFPKEKFNIDLKDDYPAQVGSYAAVLRKHGAENRVLTASQYGANLKEARRLLPGMATSFSLGEVIGVYFLFRTGFLFLKKNYPGDAFQVPEYLGPSHLANASLIRFLHRKGVTVQVWTVDGEDDMRRLLEAGVDGIFSNDPALLIRVIS